MSGKNLPKFIELPPPQINESSKLYSDIRSMAYRKLCSTPIPDNSVESYRKIKLGGLSISDFLKKEGKWESSGTPWKKISECSDDLITPFKDELLRKIESKENEFFTLLSLAYTQEPIYLEVSEKTGLEEIIYNTVIPTQSSFAFPVHFIKIKNFSNGKIIDTIKANSGSNELFLGAVTIVLLEASSNLELIFLEELNESTIHFRDITVVQKSDSNSKISYYNMNGLKGKTKFNFHLREKGASTKISGVAAPTKREFQDVEFSIFHEAGNTNSSLLFNTVMKDRAHHIFTGNLIIPRTSSRVEASQVNHNLMLEKSARAESMPKLEVLADDVKCSHGATMSEVDDSQIFYLQSRGLDTQTARHLIVEGFLSEIIENSGSEEFKNSLLQKFLDKLMV